MNDKLRVAGYCRVSTDRDDQINSLTSQIRYFTEYIEQHPNWELVEIYYDEGISGTSIKKRDGFNRMMHTAMHGGIDLILTKEVSRFARNTVDTLSCTRRLKGQGVGVVFTLDNIDTRDSDGELRLTINASMAQEESRRLSERVKWGQKRRMEQGIVFGRDMLGYAVREGKLILNPTEAEIVRSIYRKFLVEGKGTHVIARELREAGIRPKRVTEWSNTVILRVLRNEKYVGDLRQKKTFTPDYLTHAKKYNRGQEEMVYIKDHHEAIIDRDTWDRTQAELKRRSPSDEQKTKHSNRYWCSGKLICGECGRRFVSRRKQLRGGGTHTAWQCYASVTHGQQKTDPQGNTIGCNSRSINERALQYCVRYAIRCVQVNRASIVEDVSNEIRMIMATSKAADPAPLQAQIERINDKKRRVIDLVLDGTISREDLKRQTEVYDADISSLNAQIAQVKQSALLTKSKADKLQECIAEVERIVSCDADNVLLYRELIDHVEIYTDKSITVYLNHVPFGIKLNYTTQGRNAAFTTAVSSMEIIK